MRARTNTPRWELAATAGVLLYAAARLVYLALSLDPSLPPDEITHVGQARHQVAYWGSPVDTESSYVHGLVSHRPFGYAWLLARWLALDPGLTSELVWLRLANIGLAGLTLLAALSWARRAGAGPGERVLLALLLTNLPMWSFLSASVSYDNLAMALATLAFALLARYLDEHSPEALLGLAAVLLLGVLTKAALLPFAALVALALLASERGAALRGGLTALRRPQIARPGIAALLAVTLGLAALAGALYGRNLAKFGVLEPAANQVLPLEAARRNRIFLQEHVLRSYRAGAIDQQQAASELQRIEHPADRAGAMWLLRRARELREGTGEPLVGRVRYATLWLPLMAERLFGVMGHRALYKSGLLAAAYSAVALGALAALAWRVRRPGVHLRIAAGVALGYALILMQLVNLPIYRASGLEVEAVQGRYLFPVLAPLLSAAIIASRALLPARARVPVAIAVALLFVLGDFPYLLWQAGPEWWGEP
ncbi:MAG: DUF2142 domain-containing protein [Myxococcota bacterium]|nr:DUF2142 domain-containing protein [Myxococcota bacterium]